MGKFIVIEGTDCSGKETQSKLLVEKLNNMGHKAIRLTFPNYDTPTGKIVGGPYLGKKEIHVLEYSPNDGSMNLLYTDNGINNLQMNGYSKIFYNKDKTNLVETTNSGYTISGGYVIRNGVCYCNISIKCTTPVSYYTIITTQSELGLPTSELVPCYLNFINDEQPSCISVYMGTENIEVRGGVAGKTYTYSGSFPIKVKFK